MIRIDEIYNHTFWPWIKHHRPGTRMFVCDPFGRSDPDSVINFGNDATPEHNYIFFFDQEPIHLNIHIKTFNEVERRNRDMRDGQGAIITSEKNSYDVNLLCEKYRWRSHYYFFHGWAALDWYRGYDKTFLITPAEQRRPNKTFIAPNRIIAGARQHRLEMLYWIFALQMQNNYISCPLTCPAENVSIFDAIKSLPYTDAYAVFRKQSLPLQFAGETDHPMHSCWLSLFEQCSDSLLYLVTETVAQGQRLHLTEKTFKPIALGMPFVLVATQGSLEYLRSYGFRTFGDIWDESYDNIVNTEHRIATVAQLLRSLDNLSQQQRVDLFQQCLPIIQHNWNHFYNGGFEKLLWQELESMLNGIEFDS